ncbi:MAG: hypothetical protein J1E64_14685, partial [Acetatifactor sp.]|nr:hypothetical protein [Acetatifactor sp.]
MGKIILDILYLLIVTIAFFMIRKYVFFEPDLAAKKQHFFYVISFLAALIVQFAFGDDYVPTVVSLMVGLNSCLARKKHRFLGLLVALIPLPGIANGLLTPMTLLPYAIDMSEQAAMIYQHVFCGVLLCLVAIFYVKGKSWRSWFDENMQDRSLDKSEQWLLWAVGIMMLILTNVISLVLSSSYSIESKELSEQIFLHILGGCFEIFFMTTVIIGLILQGNKQSFYYEKVVGMQSGMITLMADIVEN